MTNTQPEPPQIIGIANSTAHDCPLWLGIPFMASSTVSLVAQSVRTPRASLLDLELQRCVDGAAVLRVGAQTQMQLTFADLSSCLARLRELKKMPASGSDLRQFLEKVRTP